MTKLNCWEFKKCGREPGGSNVPRNGVCPAATLRALDGVHDGRNAGRACWVAAGTLCRDQVQGSFAQKMNNCLACDFYQVVRNEEGDTFVLSVILLKRLSVAPK